MFKRRRRRFFSQDIKPDQRDMKQKIPSHIFPTHKSTQWLRVGVSIGRGPGSSDSGDIKDIIKKKIQFTTLSKTNQLTKKEGTRIKSRRRKNISIQWHFSSIRYDHGCCQKNRK